MELKKWCIENSLNQDSIDMLVHLSKVKPYSDDEIIEAVETIYKVSKNIGISIDETVSMVAANEILGLK